MKIILRFLFLFIPASAFCQIFWPSPKDSLPPTNEETAAAYYYQGVENYENEKFSVADSFYTLSVKRYPSINAYYSQALIRNKRNDVCGFCHCLKKASLLGDKTSMEYYNKYCVTNDTDLLKYYTANLPLFKQAVIQNPNPDVFLDMAVTEAKFANKCAFCENLESDFLSKMTVIEKLALKICYTSKKNMIQDSVGKKNFIYNIVYTETCSKQKKYKYIECSPEGDTLLIIKTDKVQAGNIVDVERIDFLPDSNIYILKIDTTELGANIESLFDYVQIKVKKSDEVLLSFVEEMPFFEGGERKMYDWLAENIKYPMDAKEKGTVGTVIITFVVEKDGSVTNVVILKDIGDGCGEEGVRVVKLMPKWIPGKQDGKPVRVKFNLPIRFVLGDYTY